MVDFVEQATLRIRDQSTGPINKINKAITNLLKNASRLNNIKVGLNTTKANSDANKLAQTLKSVPKAINTRVKVNVTGAANAQKVLSGLNRSSTIGLRVRLTNLPQIRQQLNQNMQLANPRIQNNAGRGFAASFLDALRPHNAGASIARGFLAAVGGNLQQAVARATSTGLNAPLNKEDAVQRLQIAGATDQTVEQVQKLASELSSRFKGTTEASIIDASVEAVGRIPDTTTEEGAAALRTVLERIARNTQISASVQGKGIVAGGDTARLIEGAIAQVGATGNKEEAERISTAALRGIIASGGDLSGQDVKRVLQQLGGARGGLSEDTLTQLLLLRDEGGARGTGEFRQVFQDATRTNLNDEDFNAQVKNGLRDSKGRSTIAAGLQNNFLQTVRDEIIPRLIKEGVRIDDKTDVLSGVDRLGFVAPGAIATLTDAVVNMANLQQEFERSQQARPNVAIDSPTVRAQAQAVNAQFQNVADNALGGLLPVVSAGLDTLSSSLASFNKGEAGVTDFATLGAGAITAGIGAAIMSVASASPAERPLALAGLSLNTSAAALSASAAALTTAAGVQAGGNLLGKGGGLIGSLKGILIAAGVVAASEAVQVPLDAVGNTISPGSVERAKANEAEIAKRGYDQLSEAAAAITLAFTEKKPSAEVASRIIANTKDTSDFIKIGEPNLAAASPDFASLLNAMNTTPTELATAFDTGNAGLTAASTVLSSAAEQFGPIVAAALLATGGPLGAQIGAAISASINSASVNVNATVKPSEPSLDTGSQVPLQ